MTQAEVLAHHSSVTKQEHEFFMGHYQDKLSPVKGLNHVLSELKYYQRTGTRSALYISPRPSLAFFHMVFAGIEDDEASAEVADSGLELLGSLLLPQAGLAKPEQQPMPGNLVKSSANSCKGAEAYFIDTVNQIKSGEYAGQDRVSVYHDESGRPLALRKSHEASTALTLVPIQLGAAVIPAGIIADVGHDANTKSTGMVNYDDYMLETFDVGKVISIAPLRVSPWAYANAPDRTLFGVSGMPATLTYDGVRGEQAAGGQLANFEQAAQTIMTLCGTQVAQVALAS